MAPRKVSKTKTEVLPNIYVGMENGRTIHPNPITITISGGRRSGKTVLRAKLAGLLAGMGNQVVIEGQNRQFGRMYLDQPLHLYCEPRTIIIVDKE